jgi:hypothetical protein
LFLSNQAVEMRRADATHDTSQALSSLRYKSKPTLN